MNLEDTINFCLGAQIDIGAPTPEPSVWNMVYHYYTSHGIEPETARHYTDKVCGVFVTAIVYRQSSYYVD